MKSPDYFTSHWQDNELPEIPAVKLHVAERFLAPLLNVLQQGSILDVGTGDGVHLAYLKQAAPSIACTGIDISSAAVRTAAKRNPDACLLHADAQQIPLADASVDASFSYGVLAYLPDPWKGLAEMVRVTRNGGLIGLWMYPQRTDGLGKLFTWIRGFVPKLPRFWQARMADVIIPFLSLLPTSSGIHLGNTSWSACREVVLVNIAPPHLVFPAREEVIAQLHKHGCHIAFEDRSVPITLWAKKGT